MYNFDYQQIKHTYPFFLKQRDLPFVNHQRKIIQIFNNYNTPIKKIYKKHRIIS